MKAYKGYLLDLDGTVYRGNEVIPEAVHFIRALREEGIPYLYLTNNSSAPPEAVAKKLQAMGIEASPEEVYTSSMATAAYLAEKHPQGTRVHVIGEEGLHMALAQAGCTLTDQEADYVVVGIDRSFSYAKLAAAARAIRSGATLIATNRDPALPTENGLMPGNGALVAAVAAAGGTQPIVIGKPESIIVNYALKRLGTPKEETLIVGDNLMTDIAAGVNSGMDSLLVLTGYSSAADAAVSPWQPTYVADHLMAWYEKLAGGNR
ncbi:TIGR01457 family HAD-type hydrolase [Brevibacillus sp. SYP-B805]|uniref:TIGR01457 family HAD-type hydrolase n=1 Tax=Brevibacillus sp. SYP-B805 TaxID=1578199 RepID=UPI0013ECA948|nr:TIGR01457 family HAD-type hydrolase [Brevibacillus sp. SYP-B805]